MTTVLVSRKHRRNRRRCFLCCALTQKPGASSIILIIVIGSLLQIRTSLMNPYTYLSASTILGVNNNNNNNQVNNNQVNNDDNQQLPSSSSSGLALDRRRQQSTTTTTTITASDTQTAATTSSAAATTTRIIHRHDQRLDHTALTRTSNGSGGSSSTSNSAASRIELGTSDLIHQQPQKQLLLQLLQPPAADVPTWAPRVVWLEREEQEQNDDYDNPSQQQQQQRSHTYHKTVAVVVPPLTEPCPHFDDDCQDRDPYDYIWPIERPYYEECKPMADWQTNFYPTCNLFHEISLGDAAIFNNTTTETMIAATETSTSTALYSTVSQQHQHRTQTDTLQLLSMSGSWRSAWKRTTKAMNETVVLKLLKFDTRDFDQESFEHHRIDAAVMERLTHSPYIVTAYGYCGQSVMTEYASGTAREHTKNKHLNSRERLKMGRDLARAVAQLHSMDYPNSTNATFAHNDINIANAVQVNGRIKLNDFNIGNVLRWNQTHNKPCGVPVHFEAPLWKSPEENANTSYVDAAQADVYGLGNLLFQVLTTRQPWTHLEPGGKLTPEQVAVRKAAGAMPYIPTPIVQSTKIGIQALYFATVACFRFDPTQRPTSHDLAVNLNVALQWARQKEAANVTRSQVEALFAVVKKPQL